MNMNAKSSSFKMVKPNKRLSEKVGSQGGIEMEDAMERANAALAKVSTDFPDICRGWIDTLNQALSGSEAELSADTRRALLSIANDVRGQGGTFGFPLITLVADSLVKFVDLRENSAAVEASVVRVHIQALEGLVRDNVVGEGGNTGMELRTIIGALAKKRRKP
jgi:hypothetical protein